MPAHQHQQRSGCPIANALDPIGDKWSLLIIRDMMFFGKTQYGQFLESPEAISTNILADRLKQLEQHGLVTKSRHPNNKKIYEYHLTEPGIDLLPMLLEMIIWADKYTPNSQAPAAFMKKLRQNKKKVTAELRRKIKRPNPTT